MEFGPSKPGLIPKLVSVAAGWSTVPGQKAGVPVQPLAPSVTLSHRARHCDSRLGVGSHFGVTLSGAETTKPPRPPDSDTPNTRPGIRPGSQTIN